MKTASAFLATALALLPTFAQALSIGPLPPIHPAPGPLVGAGPVGLVIGGVGYGVYWLVKRRRRKAHY
jgi:hypothetical protein